MREIKFRAWEKPIFNQAGHMFEVDEIWWSKNRLKENNSAETVYSLVDCVLMQYTGLHDNTKWEDLTEEERRRYKRKGINKENWHGKEIYEGDIVEIPSLYKDIILEDGSGPILDNLQTCEVFFRDGCFGIVPDADYLFPHRFYSFKEIENDVGIELKEISVIGNIYENPELTGGK